MEIVVAEIVVTAIVHVNLLNQNKNKKNLFSKHLGNRFFLLFLDKDSDGEFNVILFKFIIVA